MNRFKRGNIGMVYKGGNACCHGDDLVTQTINRHMPYIVTADQVVYVMIY